MLSPVQSLGAHTFARSAGESNTAGAPVLIVAGAATDNVARTGPTVDRNVAGSGLAGSCVLEIAGRFTLAAAATASFRVQIQESADGTVWAAATEIQASTVAATGAVGGSNEIVNVSLDMDLSARDRYLRFILTCDLSAAGVDTGFYAAKAILGGFQVTAV